MVHYLSCYTIHDTTPTTAANIMTRATTTGRAADDGPCRAVALSSSTSFSDGGVGHGVVVVRAANFK